MNNKLHPRVGRIKGKCDFIDLIKAKRIIIIFCAQNTNLIEKYIFKTNFTE